MSKKDAIHRLEAFRNGLSNLLISTVVAEEGMDVPEANCVIRFDPVQHAVSFVQGRGRARQTESSFIIMSEQQGRSVDVLSQAEKQQMDIARSFKPIKGPEQIMKDKISQKSREYSGREVLTNITEEKAMQLLNLYCKKTKVVLNEEIVFNNSK